MSCSTGASSGPAARSWPWNWRRRATSGSSRSRRRTGRRPMPETLLSGFSRSAVEELSRRKGEPEWMLQKRLQAWETFENTPAPLGRRGDLGTLRMLANFKVEELTPAGLEAGNGAQPAQPAQDLVSQRAGLVVQRNGSVVHVELADELKQQGVILSDLESALREHPELVQQHFMTACVPVESDT